MKNKRPYSFFKNSLYSLEGFKDIIKNEGSFRLQLIVFVILNLIIFNLEFIYIEKVILIISTFIPIFAEIINSAIERVVDLVTLEDNDLAKKGKDMGAFLVLLAFIIEFFVFLLISIKYFI